MSINKNALMTVFFYLCVLNSRLIFDLLSFSNSGIRNATAVMYLLGAIILCIINFKTNKKDTLSEQRKPIGNVIVLGVLAIFASILLQILLNVVEFYLLKQPLGSQNTMNVVEAVKTAPFFLFAVTIGGPIMEEFVFRFSLINFFNQKLDIWLSAIISSFIFAVMHTDGHYLLYSALGFFFFLLYKKTGSIYTSIIAHMGMNAVVMIVQLALR